MSGFNEVLAASGVRISLGNIGNGANTGAAWTPTLNVATNLVALVTGGGGGSRVMGVSFTSTDAAICNVYLVLQKSGSTNLAILGQCQIPGHSGSAATIPNTDGFASTTMFGIERDISGKPFINIGSGDILYFGVIAAMTANAILSGIAFVQDYPTNP